MEDPEVSAYAGPPRSQKGVRLDQQFFAPGQGGGSVVQPFHHKYTDHGKELSGRKLKTMAALEKDMDPAELQKSSKKHFKGNKRAKNKVRVGGGLGDYD